MKPQAQCDFSFDRQRNVISRHKQLLKAVATLEFGERAVRIIIDVVPIRQERESLLFANFDSLSYQSIGWSLVIMLHLAKQHDRARDLVGAGYAHETDQFVLKVCAQENVSVRVSRVFALYVLEALLKMPIRAPLADGRLVIYRNDVSHKRVLKFNYSHDNSGLRRFSDG